MIFVQGSRSHAQTRRQYMSRSILEPLMAVRHLSTSPSRILATLDQELERVGFGGAASTSNTMKMALGGVGNQSEGMSQGGAVSQGPIPPFFSRRSNVVLKAVPSTAKLEVQTSRPGAAPLVDKTSSEQQAPDLPLYSYKSASPPPVRYYVRDETLANQLTARLHGPLGFDMEWRATFTPKVPDGKTAVIQFSDERMILVIQLSAMRHIPQKVKEVMERPDIIKMGVNILNDGRKLQHDYGVSPRGLLELSHLAHLADPSRVQSKRMISLQKIVAMYTGTTLSKGRVRTSNWEARLTEEQLDYAANDAHSALRVYMELMLMARANSLDLKPVVHPGASPMGISFIPDRPPNTVPSHKPTRVSRNGSAPKPTSQATNSKAITPRIGEIARATSPPSLGTTNPKPVKGQLLRAYKLWHEERLPLHEICCALRSPANPLTRGTVISYVVEALKADESLPFSRERLSELVRLEFGSLKRHGWWITSLEKTSRGLDTT